jgi:ribose transport system ATP-binding protein
MLLNMSGISKAFSGVPVLQDVAFDLKAGEVHILAGENGAGKTTLMKILAGVHTDHAGEIRIEGRTVRFKSPHDASIAGISAIHQEMSLVLSMSVRDNIFLGREKTSGGWMDFRTETKRAAALLENLAIDVNLDREAGDYPIAVRQMIEIAKALVFEAKIFIMDEPTSALNDVEAGTLFKLIRNLKERGCGIIYISHRMEEIYHIGDRISVLRDGRAVGTAPASELPQRKLVSWMVGREMSGQFPPRAAHPSGTALEVRGFRLTDRSRTGKWAIRDADFDLYKGEILGLAGLQGSGKSELLNGLFGTYGRPAAGSVRIDDRPFMIRSPKDSLRAGIALLTHDRKSTGLVAPMSLARNITLASTDRFSPGGWMRLEREARAAARHVDSLGIKARSIDQEVQTLSGGNQQKVAIAKWLETRPRVLLLDEPTAGVDVGAKHDIYELMNVWTSEGLAVLLVTSEIEELLAMSDRILVLHRGRITAEFRKGEAAREEIIRAAMGET